MTPEPPIESLLPHMEPGQITHRDIMRMRVCWQTHYRELCALLQDAHTRFISIGDPGPATGALEYAETELALLTQITGLLWAQEQIETERTAV